MVDYILLLSTVDGSGLRKDHIAKTLGITRQALALKLKGTNEFTASELAKIKEVLNLSQGDFRRIFFANERELNSHVEGGNQ